MPRKTRSQGRPGSKVFPDDWEASHAAVMAKAVEGLVLIGLPGDVSDAAWNPVTRQTETPDVLPVYSGPAAFAIVTDTARTADVVDEKVPHRLYEVTLKHEVTAATTDHVIKVVESSDPNLVGRTLSIVTVERGTRRFTRTLHAMLTL